MSMSAKYYNKHLWTYLHDTSLYMKCTAAWKVLLRAGNVDHLETYSDEEFWQLSILCPLYTYQKEGTPEWFHTALQNEWIVHSYQPHWKCVGEFHHHEMPEDKSDSLFVHEFNFLDERQLYYTNVQRFLTLHDWQYSAMHFDQVDDNHFMYFWLVHCGYCLSGATRKWTFYNVQDGLNQTLPFTFMTLCRRCYNDFQECMHGLTMGVDPIDVIIQRENQIAAAYHVHKGTMGFNNFTQSGGYTTFLRVLKTDRDLLWCNRCGIQCFTIICQDDLPDDIERYNAISSMKEFNITFPFSITFFN